MDIDLHIHSLKSGHAIPSVMEIVDYAVNKNMKCIAITEHGPSMEGAPHDGYFEMSSQMPKKIENTNILMGIEANIIDTDGTLDLCKSLLNEQSIITAGLHQKTPYIHNDTISNTTAIINSICNNNIHIITHPLRKQFNVNLSEIAEIALDNHVLLELNNRAFQLMSQTDLYEYKKMIDLIKIRKGHVILGSDSHFLHTIGDISCIKNYYSFLGLTDDIIANSDFSIIQDYILK